jgi:hypothetical protein
MKALSCCCLAQLLLVAVELSGLLVTPEVSVLLAAGLVLLDVDEAVVRLVDVDSVVVLLLVPLVEVDS